MKENTLPLELEFRMSLITNSKVIPNDFYIRYLLEHRTNIMFNFYIIKLVVAFTHTRALYGKIMHTFRVVATKIVNT